MQGQALSKRESQVALLLVQGASNKEIARKLQLSPLTIKDVVQRICAKLHCTTRLQVGLLMSNAENRQYLHREVLALLVTSDTIVSVRANSEGGLQLLSAEECEQVRGGFAHPFLYQVPYAGTDHEQLICYDRSTLPNLAPNRALDLWGKLKNWLI
jgi:DNA-binding CsgD family transcriptional regulator